MASITVLTAVMLINAHTLDLAILPIEELSTAGDLTNISGKENTPF